MTTPGSFRRGADPNIGDACRGAGEQRDVARSATQTRDNLVPSDQGGRGSWGNRRGTPSRCSPAAVGEVHHQRPRSSGPLEDVRRDIRSSRSNGEYLAHGIASRSPADSPGHHRATGTIDGRRRTPRSVERGQRPHRHGSQVAEFEVGQITRLPNRQHEERGGVLGRLDKADGVDDDPERR